MIQEQSLWCARLDLWNFVCLIADLLWWTAYEDLGACPTLLCLWGILYVTQKRLEACIAVFLHPFWLSFQLFLSRSLGKHVIDWMAKENKPPPAGDSWWLWFVNVHRIYPFHTFLFSAIPWDWTWSLLRTADDWAIPCSIQWTDLFTGVVWSFTCKEITLC